MQIEFYKYHGTGNDFILIDNRKQIFDAKNTAKIAGMCHRRFGIGADGLILLENAKNYDFRMVYFNADGKESTMCGNGGRCIVAFAKKLNIIQTECSFIAIDGEHYASINEDFEVNLQMKNVAKIAKQAQDFITDTGSPHYVKMVNDFPKDFVAEAKAIRYSTAFKKEGINVNFAQINQNNITIRTYERGVEAETYACGTGCVAVALCAMLIQQNTQTKSLKALGGTLQVSAEKKDDVFVNVFLKAATAFVYKGVVSFF